MPTANYKTEYKEYMRQYYQENKERIYENRRKRLGHIKRLKRTLPYGSSPTEIAWAAGFFDGEGCVAATQSGIPRVSLIIVQKTHKHLMERFRDAFGGIGNVRGPDSRDIYRLVVSGSVAAHVMAQMRPYLREDSPKVRRYVDLTGENSSQTS